MCSSDEHTQHTRTGGLDKAHKYSSRNVKQPLWKTHHAGKHGRRCDVSCSEMDLDNQTKTALAVTLKLDGQRDDFVHLWETVCQLKAIL